MKPDASLHDPRPEYLRALLDAAGVSQREAARRIGVSERMMRYYLADSTADHRPAPYAIQYAIESLALRPSLDNSAALGVAVPLFKHPPTD